jgi:hypothetical protein
MHAGPAERISQSNEELKKKIVGARHAEAEEIQTLR